MSGAGAAPEWPVRQAISCLQLRLADASAGATCAGGAAPVASPEMQPASQWEPYAPCHLAAGALECPATACLTCDVLHRCLERNCARHMATPKGQHDGRPLACRFPSACVSSYTHAGRIRCHASCGCVLHAQHSSRGYTVVWTYLLSRHRLARSMNVWGRSPLGCHTSIMQPHAPRYMSATQNVTRSDRHH